MRAVHSLTERIEVLTAVSVSLISSLMQRLAVLEKFTDVSEKPHASKLKTKHHCGNSLLVNAGNYLLDWTTQRPRTQPSS